MTISSDDPPFFPTTLTDELRHVVRIAGLTRDDLADPPATRRSTRVRHIGGEGVELLGEIDAWAASG